jgi:hypothetical protein
MLYLWLDAQHESPTHNAAFLSEMAGNAKEVSTPLAFLIL